VPVGDLRRSLGALALVAVGATACGSGLSHIVGRRITAESELNRAKGGGSARNPAPPVTTAATALDPSFFARGSCVSLPPTQGNRHETVFMDAGHGGVDTGAVGTTGSGGTVYEKTLTLPVEMDTAAMLRADGYRVVVSRTNGGPVAKPQPGAIVGNIYTVTGAHDDVVARDICADLSKAKVLVGIYFDGGSSPANAGCVTAYDAVRSFAAANLRFAQLLQHSVLAAMNRRGWQIPDAGVLTDVGLGSSVSPAADSYGHLVLLGPGKRGYLDTPTEMPGALIEPLFVTDPFEADIADSSLGQHVIAAGIASAVEEFLQ
jgi:N-acetylmuramoyl-L-alanine amidase